MYICTSKGNEPQHNKKHDMKNTLTFQEVRQIRLDAWKSFKANPTQEGKKLFFEARQNQLNYHN